MELENESLMPMDVTQLQKTNHKQYFKLLRSPFTRYHIYIQSLPAPFPSLNPPKIVPGLKETPRRVRIDLVKMNWVPNEQVHKVLENLYRCEASYLYQFVVKWQYQPIIQIDFATDKGYLQFQILIKDLNISYILRPEKEPSSLSTHFRPTSASCLLSLEA